MPSFESLNSENCWNTKMRGFNLAKKHIPSNGGRMRDAKQNYSTILIAIMLVGCIEMDKK